MRFLVRFIQEIRLVPVFSIIDATGKKIDLQKTFKPTSPNRMLLISIKLIIFASSIFSMVKPIDDLGWFWIAYFTNWAYIVSLLYIISSFLTMTLVLPAEQDDHEQDEDHKNQWRKSKVVAPSLPQDHD